MEATMSYAVRSESLDIIGRRAFDSFANLTAWLSKAESKYKDQLPPISLEFELQRFQLWAANLGLNGRSHRSLDYRLQDAHSVRDFVADLLRGLTENLNEGKMVLGSLQNWVLTCRISQRNRL